MRERDVRKAIAALRARLGRPPRRGAQAALVPLAMGMQLIDWGCAAAYADCTPSGLTISIGPEHTGATVEVTGACTNLECAEPQGPEYGVCSGCFAEFVGVTGAGCTATLSLPDGSTQVEQRVFVPNNCDTLTARVEFGCVDWDCCHPGPDDGT